jgi:hypothetical protein
MILHHLSSARHVPGGTVEALARSMQGPGLDGRRALSNKQWLSFISAGTFLIVGLCRPLGARQDEGDQATIADFNARVAAYVEVHNKADALVPSLKRTDDPAEISKREMALGAAIRSARSTARPNDVITKDVARIFRRLIKEDFRSRSSADRKTFLDEVPHFRPRVNDTYGSEWPLATFPATLLEKMPRLPDILEYRLLSEALILRDVKANIIVDYVLDVY